MEYPLAFKAALRLSRNKWLKLSQVFAHQSVGELKGNRRECHIQYANECGVSIPKFRSRNFDGQFENKQKDSLCQCASITSHLSASSSLVLQYVPKSLKKNLYIIKNGRYRNYR